MCRYLLRFSLSFILLVLCHLFFAVSVAESFTDTYTYQVEIVVFEYTDSNRFAVENWPKFTGNLDISKAVNLNSIDPFDEFGNKQPISIVDNKNMLLNSETNKIKNSKNQRFIQHIAWIQPLDLGVKSTPVYFTAANKSDEIAGLVTIKPAKNAFNLSIDMIYKLQPNETHLASGVNDIRITRDVKLKKKEIFYIDHPVIGMLVIISPVTVDN